MKVLKYRATKRWPEYHGEVHFKDGESKSVPDDIADDLLNAFPERFTVVNEAKDDADDITKSKKKGLRGKLNKMMTPESDK